MIRHIAVDLGASGGRVALGTIEDGRLSVEIVHRWPHTGVSVNGRLYWDALAIWKEIVYGLSLAPNDAKSVGVNTWGVDYGLLDEGGTLIDGVHHYRCDRTAGAFEETVERLGRDWLYETTGLQFLPFNTLYQLVAHRRDAPKPFAAADRLLMLPDLFHYWLSGVKANERTIASTSQLYDPGLFDWSEALLASVDLPTSLLSPLRDPGTDLGPLSDAVGGATGLKKTRVVLPASHDTASAVAAVPAQAHSNDWAYVSSGTWSLVGVETFRPFVSPRSLAESLTNEAGVNGTTRLLKNVMGLWILQECRRAWGEAIRDEIAFDLLYEEAAGYESPDVPTFDPDAPQFLAPGTDMPDRVQRAMRLAAFGVPNRGLIVRSILESLAAKTAKVIDSLERVTDRTIRTVHIVGGGSQIDLLNRLIARRTGRRVVAGPVEATLMGNLLVQAEACGSIPKGTIRDVVRECTELRVFEP